MIKKKYIQKLQRERERGREGEIKKERERVSVF